VQQISLSLYQQDVTSRTVHKTASVAFVSRRLRRSDGDLCITRQDRIGPRAATDIFRIPHTDDVDR